VSHSRPFPLFCLLTFTTACRPTTVQAMRTVCFVSSLEQTGKTFTGIVPDTQLVGQRFIFCYEKMYTPQKDRWRFRHRQKQTDTTRRATAMQGAGKQIT